MIADTLLEARRYAEEEREETKKQEQKLRRILEEESRQQRQILDQHRDQIRRLRGEIKAVLELAEKKFEALEEQSSALLETAPAGNMSLFTAKEDETV